MSIDKDGLTWGYRIEWRPSPFKGTRAVSAEGYSDPVVAKTKVLDMAQKWGYRPPRWWEYWRWGETVPKLIEQRESSHAAS